MYVFSQSASPVLESEARWRWWRGWRAALHPTLSLCLSVYSRQWRWNAFRSCKSWISKNFMPAWLTCTNLRLERAHRGGTRSVLDWMVSVESKWHNLVSMITFCTLKSGGQSATNCLLAGAGQQRWRDPAHTRFSWCETLSLVRTRSPR